MSRAPNYSTHSNIFKSFFWDMYREHRFGRPTHSNYTHLHFPLRYASIGAIAGSVFHSIQRHCRRRHFSHVCSTLTRPAPITPQPTVGQHAAHAVRHPAHQSPPTCPTTTSRRPRPCRSWRTLRTGCASIRSPPRRRPSPGESTRRRRWWAGSFKLDYFAIICHCAWVSANMIVK